MSQVNFIGDAKYPTAAVAVRGDVLASSCIKAGDVISVNHEKNVVTVVIEGITYADVGFLFHTDVGYESYKYAGLPLPAEPLKSCEHASRLFICTSALMWVRDQYDELFVKDMSCGGANRVTVLFDQKHIPLYVVNIISLATDQAIVFAETKGTNEAFFKTNNRKTYYPYLLITARHYSYDVISAPVNVLYDLLSEKIAKVASEDGKSILEVAGVKLLTDFAYILKYGIAVHKAYTINDTPLYNYADYCIQWSFQFDAYFTDAPNQDGWTASTGGSGYYMPSTTLYSAYLDECNLTPSGAVADALAGTMTIPEHAGTNYASSEYSTGGRLGVTGQDNIVDVVDNGLYHDLTGALTLDWVEVFAYDLKILGGPTGSDNYIVSSTSNNIKMTTNLEVNEGTGLGYFEHWRIYGRLIGGPGIDSALDPIEGFAYCSYWRFLAGMAICNTTYDLYDDNIFTRNDKFLSFLTDTAYISSTDLNKILTPWWTYGYPTAAVPTSVDLNNTICTITTNLIFLPYNLNDRKLGLIR